MSRSRKSTRDGASNRGMSPTTFNSIMGDWDTDEDEEEDKVDDIEELYGDEDGWAPGDEEGDTTGENSIETVEDNQSNPRIIGIRDPPVQRRTIGDEDEVPRRGRPLLRNRAIKNLADALNPEHYDLMSLPGVSQRREVSAILEKKTRKDITFKNWKRTNRSRNPR